MKATRYPDPYIQPDPQRDCTFYATAYLARCLGVDVAARDIMAWREQTGRHEEYYLQEHPAIETRSWWTDLKDEQRRRRWWLGPDGQQWVRDWIDEGWIAYCCVHRVSPMTHAVAVLDADNDGVLLMDPVLGFVCEPWPWFLGVGAGTYGCHRIGSWHRKADLVKALKQMREDAR